MSMQNVGKNLSDQPQVWNKWIVNSTDTWDDVFRNDSYQQELLEEWRKSRMGPLVDSIPSHIVRNRLPADSPIFQQYDDPSAGPGTPHIELGLQNGWGVPLATLPEDGYFIGAGVCVVTPHSRMYLLE
ncbi:hypothetical protein CPB85DRAFT_1428368 [Mucidula mucida]|nr:hypothetical protein CPB85DRAFT_1428368 [Mucidula mucida]